MHIDVITIFPDYLDPVRQSLPGKAIESGIIGFAVHDLRRWTHDVHHSVDDSPYGGGPGMVMKAPVWGEALDEICTADTLLVVPTPAGRPFTQSLAQHWTAESPSGVRLRSLRGYRPARRRRRRHPDARGGGLDRRLRAGRRRGRRSGHDRGDRAADAGRDGKSVFAQRRFPLAGTTWVGWRDPVTLARRYGAGSPCPRCCSPAITAGSQHGAVSRRWNAPGSAAPTCSAGVTVRSGRPGTWS